MWHVEKRVRWTFGRRHDTNEKWTKKKENFPEWVDISHITYIYKRIHIQTRKPCIIHTEKKWNSNCPPIFFVFVYTQMYTLVDHAIFVSKYTQSQCTHHYNNKTAKRKTNSYSVCCLLQKHTFFFFQHS